MKNASTCTSLEKIKIEILNLVTFPVEIVTITLNEKHKNYLQYFTLQELQSLYTKIKNNTKLKKLRITDHNHKEKAVLDKRKMGIFDRCFRELRKGRLRGDFEEQSEEVETAFRYDEWEF